MSTTFPDTDGRTALGVLRRPISPLLLVVKIKRESPLPYESFQRFVRSLRVPSV